MVISSKALAQCTTGSQAQLNWDALDFLHTNGSYAGYVTSTAAATQKFAFGTQKVTITHNYTGTNTLGVMSDHTGETGSNGAGADVKFLGNGAITFTFDVAVQNVKFSLYDIDVNQRAAITAGDGVTSGASITLSTITGTGLTITNNNSATARVDASSSAQSLTSTAGTVNVSIAGPVTSVTITITNTGVVTGGPASGREDGAFWLSDVTACSSSAAFASNYYSVSTPWTGQPGYVLTVVNNTIYQIDPATGKAKSIFTDAGASNINSLAYDPVKHYIYYTYSLTSSPSTDKTVKKYDYNTGTISTFISDVTSLGIPVYESGVESGSAAFYDGKLYLGIEGYASGGTTSMGRKSNVWRIDIDATTGSATGAVLAYSVAADNGTSSSNTHDWSDIGINNGVLYDFDGSAGNEDVYQYNMYTGVVTRYTPVSTFTPNQVSVDYQGNVYNVNAGIAKYNGTTNVGTVYTMTATGLPASGSYGDGAEAFKPMGDLGDAPASYDPVANSPAVHEVNTNLRLGAAVTSEWSKNTSTLATGDADDGMPTPSIVINNSNYVTNVNVYNNTGAAATVCAWVDFNSNGLFDASEGITVNVPSSSSTQTVQLFWPTPTTTLTNYSYTFIRIRVTSATNGMTTSNATGYFSDGEVEDYRIQVNAYLLPSNLLSFDARKDGTRSQLRWNVSDELAGTSYLLQRSADGRRWEDLQHAQATQAAQQRSYVGYDLHPVSGINYYRLQLRKPGGQIVWSAVRELNWGADAGFVLTPNPTSGALSIEATAPADGTGTVRIYTAAGGLVLRQDIRLPAGSSRQPLSLPAVLPAGTYLVELETAGMRSVQRLVLRR
ncbi:hypothetical protein GCM10028786_18180 [Flaviaesturariibacter terrae]